MIRRAVLTALDAAAQAGSLEAARPALAGLDPILRWRAAARLRQIAARARVSTVSDDSAHVARVAFLIAAVGLPGASFDDAAEISREYESARAELRPPRRGPWLTLALALGLLALAVTAAVLPVVLRPYDPRREIVGQVLSKQLPELVVALSRGGANEDELARIRRAAGPAGLEKKIGADGVRALDELMESAVRLARDGGDTREPLDRFNAAAASFDKLLAAKKQPFFVDTDVLVTRRGPSPIVLSFYIEQEAQVVFGDVRVRVVHLWRLDDLNLVQGYLGYTRPSTPAALVLLDQIESDLVQYVLPALPEGEPMSLVDVETQLAGEAWVAPLEELAGRIVREHFARVPEARTAEVERVGVLLARRRALIRKWRADLAGLGHILRVPERLIPEADYSRDLELRISRAQLGEWDSLHDELTEKALLGAFVKLREGYVRAVERHEVQHRLDYARGLVPVPRVVCEMLGKDDPLDAPEGSLAARTRDELSAYLASAVRAEHSPLLELVLLSRHLFDKGALGGAYWYAALAAYRSIASELDIEPDRLLGKGRVNRESSAELVKAVLSRPSEQLRRAAERVYEREYAQKVPDVQRSGERRHRPWRH